MGKQFGTAACADCGDVFKKTSPVHKYCAKCSEERSRERGRIWARNNYSYDPESARPIRQKKQSEVIARGVRISRKFTSGIACHQEPELAWLVRLKIPFTFALSKNHVYSPHGWHVRNRQSRNEQSALIESRIRDSVTRDGCSLVVPGKVWIDIFVQKPAHRGDATNFVDHICDAVKRGIGVDDRWFAIRRVDWEICKHNPQIFIGIGQEVREPHQACSSCGRLLTYDNFRKSSHCKNGVMRNCRDCLRIPRQRSTKKATKTIVDHQRDLFA